VSSRNLNRIDSESDLRAAFVNALEVGFDKADSDRLKFKDRNGVVRDIVTVDDLVGTLLGSAIDGLIRMTEVVVSSAELLALRAAPKTLVAAPGAGKMLVFHGAVIIADNGTAYVVGTNDAAIRYVGTAGDIISQVIDTAGLLDQTTDIMTYVDPVGTDSKTPKADCENTPLVLHNTGAAEWTTGTGVVRVKIYTSIVTTGW
jgi:hypothetical protein